ncbi:MAG: T9SS type A sorting domain-containing protein [Ignavibacteria bacterium]|nr:T9SS type A sorting domain-containing protein [Ignavibacteria bacterium]
MKKIIMLISLFAAANTFAQYPQWRLANGIEGTHIAAITIFPNNPDTLYAVGRGFFRSTDRGEHWDSLSGFLAVGSALKTDPFNPNIIYASSVGIANYDIVISTDGGQTWTTIFFVTGLFSAPFIEIDPKDRKTVYVGVGPCEVWRSSDYGQTWDSVTVPQIYCIINFKIAPSNDSIMYAAYGIGILKSTDKGNSWTQTAIPTGAHFLAVHPKNPDIVYAAISVGESRGVYKTTDGGQTWDQLNNGLDSLQGYGWINTIVINPNEPETIYLGVSSSNSNTQNPILFRSIDGANSWYPFDDGLPEYGSVRSIAIDTLNERIYLGVSAGSGGGVYIYDGLTSIDTKTVQTPNEFLLYQNYPNPFNPATTIEYSIPKASFVELKIYDILGGEVVSLVKENKPSGKYSVKFNASNLPSGIYFYRIVSGNFTATKKLIILK